MKKILFLLAIILTACFTVCKDKDDTDNRDNTDNHDTDDETITLGQDDFIAYFTETPPVIDGNGNDAAWAKANWQDIKYAWMYQPPKSLPTGAAVDSNGAIPKTADFSGRFKVVWTADRLYILAEIIDDIIYTPATNPTQSPEKNDCLELFIDENASGGIRTSDGGNNFFTYHMNFDGI
ncbi:sugar-binding protein, partial [Treponema sp. R80B11-R83G3]